MNTKKGTGYRQADVLDFIQGGEREREILLAPGEDPTSCRIAYSGAIRRLGFNDKMRAYLKGGRVYITREPSAVRGRRHEEVKAFLRGGDRWAEVLPTVNGASGIAGLTDAIAALGFKQYVRVKTARGHVFLVNRQYEDEFEAWRLKVYRGKADTPTYTDEIKRLKGIFRR